MLFTCKPVNGMVVIINPGKTIFQGPYDKQNVMGTEVTFKGGFFEVDASYPQNLELVEKLIKHPQFNEKFWYVKQPIPILVNGLKATLEGYTLEEALKVARESCAARSAGDVAPPLPAPEAAKFATVVDTDIPGFDTPLVTKGPSITTGVMNSKTMVPTPPPAAKKKGPPGSKFVKPVVLDVPASV